MSIDVMTRASTRKAYGRALVALAEENEHIVALDADLAVSTQSAMLGKRFPERFFDLGIAEANMIGTAAGLALMGKIPFASTFAAFVIGRFDQIKLSIAYSNANVTIVGTHAGVGTGPDGYSQMALEDLALMRSLPNVLCLQPADDVEVAPILRYLVEHEGPAFLRLTRQDVIRVHAEPPTFTPGRGEVLLDGGDVTIVASGATVGESLAAAMDLQTQNIHPRVVNMSSIKPLDVDLLVRCAEETGGIVTVEDHGYIGGLGSAVCEALAEHRPAPVRRIAVRDAFGESGEGEELYAKFGLDPAGIRRSVTAFVKRQG